MELKQVISSVREEFGKMLRGSLDGQVETMKAMVETAKNMLENSYNNRVLKVGEVYSDTCHEIQDIGLDLEWPTKCESLVGKFERYRKNMYEYHERLLEERIDKVRSPALKATKPMLRGMQKAIKTCYKTHQLSEFRNSLISEITRQHQQVLYERVGPYIQEVRDAAKLPELQRELVKLDIRKLLDEPKANIEEARGNLVSAINAASQIIEDDLASKRLGYKPETKPEAVEQSTIQQ